MLNLVDAFGNGGSAQASHRHQRVPRWPSEQFACLSVMFTIEIEIQRRAHRLIGGRQYRMGEGRFQP
jgi:hypothetical protein